jgi:Thiol-activated cytolysin
MWGKKHSGKHRAYAIRCYLLPAVLLFFSFSQAQPKKNSGAISQDGPPAAHSMKEFAKTPQGAKRQQQYGKAFGSSDKGEASKDIKYSDGTSVHLKMVKNPSFGDQPTSIMAKIKHEPKIKSDHSTDSKGQQWTCSTDHVQLSATSTTFLNNDYSSSASHIYPGACYTFADFYNGSYKEQTGERNPITIITDNTNIKGSSFIKVRDPDMGTIRNAVDNLFRETTRSSASESLTYQIYETSNDADQSIKISGGASGYGVSLNAGYSNSSQSKTINLTIDAIKTLFSINTVPPDSGFFKDPNVERTPNLMVIGSVSYGVRVLANMTVTFNSQQEEADFAASYSGFGVSANVAFDQISKSSSVSSTINCYVVGGPGNSTLSFDKKDLQKEIEKIMSGATYKNAMPVKYEFYDMAGNVVGSKSATDDFAVRQCIPGKDDPRLESVFVQFQTANDGKNGDDNYTLILWPGNDNISSNKQYGDMVFEYNQSGSAESGLEYQGNTTYSVKMESVNKPATLSQFTKHGGQLLLSIFPNGSDTWQNSVIMVTLNFEGGLGPATPIKYTNINIDQNSPHRVLYFDGNFKAQ